MPNRLQTITDPLESYIKYFLDVKPYHTKILEVVETYVFKEEMRVDMIEEIFKHITINNDPLCEMTGFGLIYDHPCGYDAVDCCNLFDCFGGYGFIFDNSDLLIDLPVQYIDDDDGYVSIEGNHTVDTRLPIVSIPATDRFVVSGDQTQLFNTHNLFVNVNVAQIEIESNENDQIIVNGDWTDLLSPKHKFFIVGTDTEYNGTYYYTSVTHDQNTDKTIINLSSSVSDNVLEGLLISVRNSNPNTGIYHPESVVYDSNDDVTTVILSSEYHFIKDESQLQDYELGSIQLRTGLKYHRLVELGQSPQPENEHFIFYSEYNPDTNSTRVHLSGDLSQYDEVSDNLKLYGYFFPAGFDGGRECDNPSETNIHSTLTEMLSILRLEIEGELPDSLSNTPYYETLSIVGGGDPFSLDNVVEPPNVSVYIDGNNIVVDGEFTTVGPNTISFRLYDSRGLYVDFEQTIQVVELLQIQGDFPDGQAYTNYETTLPISGGAKPYFLDAYDVAAGLDVYLDGDQIKVEGIPTEFDVNAEPVEFSVEISDSSCIPSLNACPQEATLIQDVIIYPPPVTLTVTGFQYPICASIVELSRDIELEYMGDPNDLSFKWEQISGDTVTIIDDDTFEARIDLTGQSASDRLFKLTVNEGQFNEEILEVPIFSRILSTSTFNIGTSEGPSDYELGTVEHQFINFFDYDNLAFTEQGCLEEYFTIGLLINNPNIDRVVAQEIEEFDPLIKNWQTVSSIISPESQYSLEINENNTHRIVTYWGEPDTLNVRKTISSIIRYNPLTDKEDDFLRKPMFASDETNISSGISSSDMYSNLTVSKTSLTNEFVEDDTNVSTAISTSLGYDSIEQKKFVMETESVEDENSTVSTSVTSSPKYLGALEVQRVSGSDIST